MYPIDTVGARYVCLLCHHPPQEMGMHEPSDKATRIESIRRTRARAGWAPAGLGAYSAPASASAFISSSMISHSLIT